MHSLPNELITRIFINCRRADLFQLALVDRRLSSIAYYALYTSFIDLDSSRGLDFLVSICFHRHLARLVRSVLFDFNSVQLTKPIANGEKAKRMFKLGVMNSFSQRHLLNNRLTLLNSALVNMPQLEELCLYVDEDKDENLVKSILRGCTFQLRIFKTALTLGPTLARFLPTQVNLRQFHFNTGEAIALDDEGILPRGCLPQLQNLGWSRRTPMNTVKRLLENRAITNITVFFDKRVTTISPILDIGLEASVKVQTATFTYALSPIAEHLQIINNQFPNISHLKISLPRLFEATAYEITPCLKHFPNLRRFTISAYGSVDPDSKPDALLPLVKVWFAQCANLEYVLYPTPSPPSAGTGLHWHKSAKRRSPGRPEVCLWGRKHW